MGSRKGSIRTELRQLLLRHDLSKVFWCCSVSLSEMIQVIHLVQLHIPSAQKHLVERYIHRQHSELCKYAYRIYKDSNTFQELLTQEKIHQRTRKSLSKKKLGINIT